MKHPILNANISKGLLAAVIAACFYYTGTCTATAKRHC